MIKTFRSKALADLWSTGQSRKIDERMHKRIVIRLSRLDEVERVEEMDFAGYDFHALKGHSPKRYTVHVNGPWCITFEFADGHAYTVDFEQYH